MICKTVNGHCPGCVDLACKVSILCYTGDYNKPFCENYKRRNTHR